MVEHISKYEDEYDADSGNFTRCQLTYAVGREYLEEKNPVKRGGALTVENQEDSLGRVVLTMDLPQDFELSWLPDGPIIVPDSIRYGVLALIRGVCDVPPEEDIKEGGA